MSDAIDLQHLSKYVGDDSALRDEVLAIFSQHAGPLLERLVADADDESWRDAAHTLKGGARGIGAWAIGDICEAAEKLVGGAPGQLAERKAAIERLRALIDEVLAEARRLRGRAA